MTAAKLAPGPVYTVFAIEKPSIQDPYTVDGKVTYGIYSIYSYIRVPHIYGLRHPYSYSYRNYSSLYCSADSERSTIE